MNRLRQEAIKEEMVKADQSVYKRIDYKDLEKVPVYKWKGVKHVLKSQHQKSFWTEEEVQQYLKGNPHLTINQRFGFDTQKINVEFYERAWAVTEMNPMGYHVPKRWLTEEEVEEYLKDPKATI